MAVKNIMFDLGGVIMTIDQPSAVERFKEIGLKDADTRLDPYTQSGIFGDLEEGKITDREFIAELSKLVGRELSYDECKYAWRGYTKEVPMRNIKVLDKLKSMGYRLILISNTNPFMMDWAMSSDFSGDGRPLSAFFDSLYMSYKMKVMKPNERMFCEIIRQEGINPEETLFVDDGPKNVSMGKALGLKTFCPKNGEDWTNEIMKFI
ncbi:MAG TPA: HAD family phosphatase [Prevotella sp.]|nr:HAD family phosphatase [Prevotella sp.]